MYPRQERAYALPERTRKGGPQMKLTFLGAAHEVTGSSILIEACGRRLLIDCGMEQGPDIYENQPLPIAPGELDAILLTHAHIRSEERRVGKEC